MPKITQPFCDCILIVAANHLRCDLLEFLHGIGNSVCFVCHFKHIDIVFAVTEYDDLLAAQEVF